METLTLQTGTGNDYGFLNSLRPRAGLPVPGYIPRRNSVTGRLHMRTGPLAIGPTCSCVDCNDIRQHGKR